MATRSLYSALSVTVPVTVVSADGKVQEVKKVKINWSMALGLGSNPRNAGKVAVKQVAAVHKEAMEKQER